MKKEHVDPSGVHAVSVSRRARLQELLFAGAALGTALVVLGASTPKLPPNQGE
jgi:hypothetical protein